MIPKEAEKYRPYFDEGWLQKLYPFLLSPEYDVIKSELRDEINSGIKLAPLPRDMFNAFKLCPYNKLKVVILGQDPYPTPGMADGLAFSSNSKGPLPPSLKFIYDGIEDDIYGGFSKCLNDGIYLKCVPKLDFLANQGVLLLNTALTTHEGKVGVHYELWKPFIKYLFDRVFNVTETGIVFNIWGEKAKKAAEDLLPFTHWYQTAEHPAAAHHKRSNEWKHENCFSKTNEILKKYNGEEAMIKWDMCEFK